jgi:hypothetical protein
LQFFYIEPKSLGRKKNATYEEILGYKTIEQLKDRIIGKEVESIVGHDIECIINNDLIKDLKLDLELNGKKSDLLQIREFFYRRHIVIHNRVRLDIQDQKSEYLLRRHI